MIQRSGAAVRSTTLTALALALAGVSLSARVAVAQEAAQTGTVTGRVVDEQGAGLSSAQVYLVRPAVSAQSSPDGRYTLARVPAGTHMLYARLLGFRPESTSVTVTAGGTVMQDFTLRRDPLQLQEMVVTGTQSPRTNLDASVAVTTLTATEVEAAAPRSSTEMLRYVPGFTRVESSGGEVNQNLVIRGILDQGYVSLLEDGLPVFPTFHTFFMNADNLIRFDTNIERMEVVRGGSSPLFGSNTPGAIVNFINKTGGDAFSGIMRGTGGSEGLARYDLNLNGPISDDWRFNAGGFYRYDHGVRNPGYPGINGGQFKASITRLLDEGYVRFSAKYIDDENLFIVPLPFTNLDDPDYVSGFTDYGSMYTPEGIDVRVPTPTGTPLTLPLDNGLKTRAGWFTVDVSLPVAEEWQFQNTAQVMSNDQEWNGIPNGNLFAAQDYVTDTTAVGGLGFPAGSTGQYFFTNVKDAQGNPVPFDTPNGLVARQGEWHVEKPISAVQDQVTVRRRFGRHSLSLGGYFGYYTQENRWYFTDILTDIRDIPHLLDLVVTPAGGGAPVNVTQNGFRRFISDYKNGTGQATILSGVLGGEVQLTDRLRADLGVRVEYNDYVQHAENTSDFDLDANPATLYDNIVYGNNSFRHFTTDITDWSASLGLNYRLNDNVSLYGAASRGYKMPALDEFLNATSQAQVDIFEAREVQAAEAGVKYGTGVVSVALNGFYTKLKNITGQGAVIGGDGSTTWRITVDPENRSYGAELEAFLRPVQGVTFQANATVLEAELGPGIDSLVGERLGGAPAAIGNVAALFSPTRAPGLQFKADWHYVGSRFLERPQDRFTEAKLPEYNYFNFGVGWAIPNSGARLNVDLLNAFQSKGLEEGNPRLVGVGVTPFFFARPLLPRRLQASVEYTFGGRGARTSPEGAP